MSMDRYARKGMFLRGAAVLVLALVCAAGLPVDVVSAYDSAEAVVLADEAAQQQRGESELPWLFAVYAITWAAFFGYVFVMARRQTEMRREIDALKRALDERERF